MLREAPAWTAPPSGIGPVADQLAERLISSPAFDGPGYALWQQQPPRDDVPVPTPRPAALSRFTCRSVDDLCQRVSVVPAEHGASIRYLKLAGVIEKANKFIEPLTWTGIPWRHLPWAWLTRQPPLAEFPPSLWHRVTICPAAAPEHITLSRTLFEEYESWLGIDLSFQGFAAELAGLPGVYAPPHGRLLLAMAGSDASGCVALRPLGEGICEFFGNAFCPDRGRLGACTRVCSGRGFSRSWAASP